MVFLCPPEGLGRLDLGDDALGFVPALDRKLLNLGASLGLLLRRVEEDGRAILRAPVRALAVEGSGVVECKKRVQELLKADLRGVEIYLDDLGVAGLVGANVLVAGLLQ